MKNILSLLFCLCLIFSSLSFAKSAEQQTMKNELNFVSSKIVAENSIPDIFRPIGNWFKRIFGKKREPYEPPPPSVKNLTLSQIEVIATCSTNNNACSDNAQSIEISTESSDPEDNVLTYVYQVSGGKIIGKGAKVVWDLSGVKPGTYTIIAAMDDGCGGCGKTVTKEIKVIECPNCN